MKRRLWLFDHKPIYQIQTLRPQYTIHHRSKYSTSKQQIQHYIVLPSSKSHNINTSILYEYKWTKYNKSVIPVYFIPLRIKNMKHNPTWDQTYDLEVVTYVSSSWLYELDWAAHDEKDWVWFKFWLIVSLLMMKMEYVWCGEQIWRVMGVKRSDGGGLN